MTRPRRFTITDDHIKLIRHIIICTDFSQDPDCYPVVIGVNSKRPFGNSDVVEDMAGILGIDPIPVDSGETEYPVGTSKRRNEIYAELGTVLQIFVRVGRMEAGEYQREQYSSHWVAMKPVGSRKGSQ